MVWNGGERCGVHANRRAANKSALSHSHQTISSHLNPTNTIWGESGKRKLVSGCLGKSIFILHLCSENYLLQQI